MKSKTVLSILRIFVAASLLTACSGFTLQEALEQGHFETIRYASFFEGSGDHLTREEFEVYKDTIIDAIAAGDKNYKEGIRLERTLKGEVLYISPYEVTISDLSPDLRIYLNGKELDNDYRSNAIRAVLNPGDNELRFVLSTGYYEDEKTILLDTTSQDSHDLTLQSGYGFRTVTVTSSDPEAYLNINGLDYVKLKQGMNRVEYVPMVPLKLKSVSSDNNLTSREITLTENQDAAAFELSERTATKPMATGSGETLTQAPSTGAPGGPSSGLAGTEADPLVEINKLLEARASDLNNGIHAEASMYVLAGSSLEEEWQSALDPASDGEHLFLGTEDGRLTVLSHDTGYVEVNVRLRIARADDEVEETLSRYRYYFQVTPEGTIGFYEARPLN